MNDRLKDRPPVKTGQFLLVLFALIISLGLYWYVSFLPRTGMITDQVTQAFFDLESRVTIEEKTAANGVKYYSASGNDDRIMSTQAVVSFWSLENDPSKLKKQVALAFWELYQIQALCNIFDERTEAAKINREAHLAPVKCSETMWELLTASRNAYKATNGAFDITAKPLMNLWGFNRKRGSLPDQTEIDETLKKVGLNKVVFDNAARTVFFPIEGMSFDFGGIAKGFAVDRAIRGAKSAGAKNGIVNLAGNMYCLGSPEPGRAKFNIGIQNPRDKRGKAIRSIEMSDMAIATSGDYERFVVIDGVTYSHIMDIRTGKPIRNMAQTTAIMPSALWCDILSTAFFINGDKYAEEFVEQNPDSAALLCRIVDDKLEWSGYVGKSMLDALNK